MSLKHVKLFEEITQKTLVKKYNELVNTIFLTR